MDTEQLRRVQETANRLKQHGVIEATNDAIEQVSNELDINGTEVPKLDISKIDQHSIQMNDTDDIKKKVEENSDLISKQAKLIYELQGKLNEIIKELNKLQTSVPTKSQNERQQMLQTEEKKEHPRSGGYKSEDVAIDKIFYTGVK